MDFLPSKTPEMVRKDFYVHLLAYNLIRHLQWEAGCQSSVKPIALSFKATQQHFRNFIPNLAYATEEQRVMRYRQLILLIASEKLLFRPNRVEPRVVKRRPKQYQRLNEPRKKLKRKCMTRKIDAKNGKYTPTY